MITVTRHDEEIEPNEETSFPILMISSKSAALVYMCGANSRRALHGICLHSGTSEYPVGQYRIDWSAQLFTPYDEPILLCNE